MSYSQGFDFDDLYIGYKQTLLTITNNRCVPQKKSAPHTYFSIFGLFVNILTLFISNYLYEQLCSSMYI